MRIDIALDTLDLVGDGAMSHQEVLVKVNAKVDRGIAPLVEAINSIPDAFTVSSCEGDEAHEPYVAFFIADGDWRSVGKVIERLTAELGNNNRVNDIPFKLSIEWYAGGATPTGYVRVPRQHVSALSTSIKSIANRLAHQLPAP
jgi:hypothetical protein